MRPRLLYGVLLAFAVSLHSLAQDYPNARRDVRHVIPWGAGGATDAAMRGFMLYFEKHLGAQVVTENIPGGLSAVGLIHVKTAPPDGYTIGTITYDVLTLELQGLAPVSWKDFEPLGMVTDHPSALVVSADRWQSLEEFRVAAIDVPTFEELGFDIVYGSFRVVVAPKATPPAIVDHLERKLQDAWNDPEFQAWARKAAIGARWRGRDDTRKYLEDLAARVRELMDELGLR